MPAAAVTMDTAEAPAVGGPTPGSEFGEPKTQQNAFDGEDGGGTGSDTDPTTESTSEGVSEPEDWQEPSRSEGSSYTDEAAGVNENESGNRRKPDTKRAEECDSSVADTTQQVTQVFSAEESILIFDWDDTVLPSTWITKQGLRLDDDCILTEEQMKALDDIAGHAKQTLCLAKEHGKVVLVTNAEAGWIELSCKKFLPSLSDSLEGLHLLSARSQFENAGVTSPFEWKYRAFLQEISGFYGDTLGGGSKKNVISFGDSAHEREAIIRVTSEMQNCRTKSLKFVERPEIDQLRKEHQLLGACFRQIVHHDGNLDLCIRCS